MADVGTIASYAEIIGALFVIGGLGFAILELRRNRAQKHRDAAFELMHSMQTPELLAGIMLVRSLPDDLSRTELEDAAGDGIKRVWQFMGQFESLGLLVWHKEVPLELVEEFWSSSILTCWPKLRRYIDDVRQSTGKENFITAYQWLVEMMLEREHHHIPIHRDFKGRFAPTRLG